MGITRQHHVRLTFGRKIRHWVEGCYLEATSSPPLRRPAERDPFKSRVYKGGEEAVVSLAEFINTVISPQGG